VPPSGKCQSALPFLLPPLPFRRSRQGTGWKPSSPSPRALLMRPKVKGVLLSSSFEQSLESFSFFSSRPTEKKRSALTIFSLLFLFATSSFKVYDSSPFSPPPPQVSSISPSSLFPFMQWKGKGNMLGFFSPPMGARLGLAIKLDFRSLPSFNKKNGRSVLGDLFPFPHRGIERILSPPDDRQDGLHDAFFPFSPRNEGSPFFFPPSGAMERELL